MSLSVKSCYFGLITSIDDTDIDDVADCSRRDRHSYNSVWCIHTNYPGVVAETRVGTKIERKCSVQGQSQAFLDLCLLSFHVSNMEDDTQHSQRTF